MIGNALAFDGWGVNKIGHFLVKWRYQISFSSSAKAVIGYASGFLPRPFVGSVW